MAVIEDIPANVRHAVESGRMRDYLADSVAAHARQYPGGWPETDPRLLALQVARIGRMGETVRIGRLGLLEVSGHVIHPHPDDVDRLNQDRGIW